MNFARDLRCNAMMFENFRPISAPFAAEPGFWVTLVIASIMAFKGRLVIDHFMELADANRTIRRMVRLYGIAIPLLLILTYVFGPQIASLTSL